MQPQHLTRVLFRVMQLLRQHRQARAPSGIRRDGQNQVLVFRRPIHLLVFITVVKGPSRRRRRRARQRPRDLQIQSCLNLLHKDVAQRLTVAPFQTHVLFDAHGGIGSP